ncbi:GLPGLI family protein [Gelidibacter sediminis]|uniref:GLPGLI family protein n=1 Tax=Gelidibacter sediminis TaxID=1608710 RepID=A0A4R7Q7X1_9FLAO|nr:GLPGLI family protein [Gelidibacter sediminis]TDU43735.1 GLPGLI family protein [Gelidibacter sediminis]
MIKLLILSIIFLSISSSSEPIDKEPINKILYSAMKIDDNLKPSDKNKSLNLIEKSIDKNDIQFELLFNSNKSIYKLKEELDTEDISKKIAQLYFGGIYVYYADTLKEKNICQAQAYGEFFIFPNETFKWELTKESAKISGYLCYKAKTVKIVTNDKGVFKKEVIAWYTPEIATNFGPKGYHGLPGLILELQEGNQIFYASNIALNTNIKIKIEKPSRGHEVSYHEFLNIGKKIGNENRP